MLVLLLLLMVVVMLMKVVVVANVGIGKRATIALHGSMAIIDNITTVGTRPQ